MIIRLDADSEIGVVDQIVTQIARSIRAGHLESGERLATVRQLAADLGVAPGTVAKAYAALEQAGFVEGLGRRGTRVVDQRSRRDNDVVPAAVSDAAQRLASLALAAGLDESEVVALMRATIAREHR